MKAVYLEEGAVNKGDVSLEPITSILETAVYQNTTEEDKYEHIGDSEVVFSNKVIFDEQTFEKCPNLKYIGVCATGYNVIDVEAAKKHGVTVTNVPAYSTESVAQLAIGLMIECASHIGLHNNSVHAGDWVKSETFCYWKTPVMELSGKVLGIVGFGNIGKRVAEIALALGMKVICHTSHPEKYSDYSDRVEFAELDAVYAKADVISLHCPMTDKTKEMINCDSIASMKHGVIIINVSRGGLVNEADLAESLKSGKVSAAACDVVSVEPMQADNPLLTAPNMVITPHMAWASLEARTRLINIVAGNLKAFLNGERLNVVS